MTLTAIFCNGWMFKQEGSALFVMAAEACFDETGLNQIRASAAAVRVMAIAARRLALLDGMSRGQIELSLLYFVTIEALFCLLSVVQYTVALYMRSMAVGTDNIFLLMAAGVPKTAPRILMTSQARLDPLRC